MRSMWLVELFEAGEQRSQTPCTLLCLLRTRAIKEIDGKHRCRWQKGTRERGELDFVGFHKSIGLTFEGSGETWGLMWLKQKKKFSTDFASVRHKVSKIYFRGNVAASPRPLQKNFLSRILLPGKCFQCDLKTISDRIKDTFLWLPLGIKFISIQYLKARNLFGVFCNWRFATLINFLHSQKSSLSIEV